METTFQDTTVASFLMQNRSLGNVAEQLNATNENQTLRHWPALSLYIGHWDDKYLNSISYFWLKFAAPAPSAHYTIAAIYFLLTVAGCFGNALVIYMFIRCKSLRTPANTLVINLAVSDFFMILKSVIPVYNSFYFGPAMGDVGCRLYAFFGGLTGVGAISTLTAISLDRYHVVVYPLDPLRSTTKNRVRMMVVFIWIYSFTFSIIPALDIGLSSYVYEGYLTSCTFDYLNKQTKARIFMFCFFFAAWCIPFFCIAYCYFYILKVVISANSIQSSKDKNKTEIKLAAVVMAIIGLWFISWTPYAIVALLGISGNEKYITPLGSMIPSIFCKSAACIDPYLYAVTHPRFRMEFGRLFLGRTAVQRSSTYRASYKSKNSSSRRRVVRDISDVDTKVMGNNNTKELPGMKGPLEKGAHSLCEESSFSVSLDYPDTADGIVLSKEDKS